VIAVDTSVLVDFFRGAETPGAQALERFERDGFPIAVPAVCCQELLQGARDRREWRKLERILSTQLLLVPQDPWACHLEAARIFFDARRKGITLRGTVDCLIAQLALEHDCALLHDDRDFDLIAEVRPLRLVPLDA
jgi:predicted nucleic acid-binding protein